MGRSLTTLAVGLSAAGHILLRKLPFITAARGRFLSMYPLMGDSLGGLKLDFQGHSHAFKACDDGRSFVSENDGDRLVLMTEGVTEMGQTTVRLRPVKVRGGGVP